MPLLAPGHPDPYLAAADLIETLPALTRLARVKLEITSKVQAKQIGIQAATLSRLEAGSVPTQTTIVRTLRWLATTGGN